MPLPAHLRLRFRAAPRARTAPAANIAARLVAVALAAAPAASPAQDGPRGIAFVQAPEQSLGVALGRTPAEAFAAATARCVEGGARAEDCLATNWCFPAGWSVDVFVMHQEGLHWHEVVCGLPSREVAQAVAAALCDRASRPFLADCLPVQLYDSEGTPQIGE